jgi:hypothetical protein
MGMSNCRFHKGDSDFDLGLKAPNEKRSDKGRMDGLSETSGCVLFFIINLGLKIVRLRTLYWPMNCRYRGYGAHTLGGSYPKQRTQA